MKNINIVSRNQLTMSGIENIPENIAAEIILLEDYIDQEYLCDQDFVFLELMCNGKRYMIEGDITKSTYGQFIDLEGYLSDGSYLINHLNEVLAIYVRPQKRKWFFKKKIEKWDPDCKEQIAKELLQMDIGDAFGLNVFFYQNAESSIKNMKKVYLNKMTKVISQALI